MSRSLFRPNSALLALAPERHHIDTLVSKHSGGAATVGKIAAAIETGAKIILIRRPLPEPGEVVETAEEAVSWLENRI